MKDYLMYVRNVLGVESLILDDVLTAKTAEMSSPLGVDFKPAFFANAQGDIRSPLGHEYKLLLLNFISQKEDSLFASEVQELFLKMQAALKLTDQEVLAIDCFMNERPLVPAEVQHFFQAQAVLMFSDSPENLGQLQIRGGFKWLETFSPAYLLSHPEAKKIVWSDMQKIMKELS